MRRAAYSGRRRSAIEVAPALTRFVAVCSLQNLLRNRAVLTPRGANSPDTRNLLERLDSEEPCSCPFLQPLVLHTGCGIREQINIRHGILDTPTDMFFTLEEEVYPVCDAESDTT